MERAMVGQKFFHHQHQQFAQSHSIEQYEAGEMW